MILCVTDYTSEHGAKVLAAKIESFWAKRGVYPLVWVEAMTVGTETLHVVRSNLGATVMVRQVSETRRWRKG